MINCVCLLPLGVDDLKRSSKPTFTPDLRDIPPGITTIDPILNKKAKTIYELNNNGLSFSDLKLIRWEDLSTHYKLVFIRDTIAAQQEAHEESLKETENERRIQQKRPHFHRHPNKPGYLVYSECFKGKEKILPNHEGFFLFNNKFHLVINSCDNWQNEIELHDRVQEKNFLRSLITDPKYYSRRKDPLYYLQQFSYESEEDEDPQDLSTFELYRRIQQAKSVEEIIKLTFRGNEYEQMLANEEKEYEEIKSFDIAFDNIKAIEETITSPIEIPFKNDLGPEEIFEIPGILRHPQVLESIECTLHVFKKSEIPARPWLLKPINQELKRYLKRVRLKTTYSFQPIDVEPTAPT